MKNKKSPLNFFPGSAGSILGHGMAMAPGKPMMANAVGNAARAIRNKRRLALGQNTEQIDPTVGVDPTLMPQVNPSVGVDTNTTNLGVPGMFNPNAMSAMGGIFGDISGRQSTLGASGVYALEKHLSPLNEHQKIRRQINKKRKEFNKDPNNAYGPSFEEINADLYAQETAAKKAHKEESPVNFNIKKAERQAKRAARKAKRKARKLGAYKPPYAPFNPTSGDDGAGGTEYDN